MITSSPRIGGLPADPAGDLGHLGRVVRGTSLVHDRELGPDHLGEADGHLRPPGVGRDGDDVLPREAQIPEVLREERQRSHVVDGDREEALDLPGVEVHRQDAVGAGELEHVGDEPRRDRLTRLRPCGPGASTGTTG